MRHPFRTLPAGFTLVELMMVVAIIALLSAVAIPAFTRYVKKSRTTEAIEQLNKEWSGSLVYYETDHMLTGGLVTPKQFPVTSAAWPNASECACLQGQRCPGNNTIWFNDGVWIALHFSLADSHHYMPGYSGSGTGSSANFTAYSKGDMNCNGVLAEFSRTGMIGPRGDVTGQIQPVVTLELE